MLKTTVSSNRLLRISRSLKNVEIEVNSRCNRRCSYCPVSINPAPQVPKLMPESVLARIFSELKRVHYSGRLSFHFYNEPLARKDLESIVKWARKELPRAKPVLFTNGDLLTDERYRSLIDAGINYIVVTAHSGRTHPVRDRQYVQYPDELALTNRGGILGHLPAARPDHTKLPCFAPDEMLIVTVSGDVVLCYEDAFRKNVMGNLCTTSLEDLWFTKKFVRYREALRAGNRQGAALICSQCTNRAHAVAGNSARSEPFWDQVDEVI